KGYRRRCSGSRSPSKQLAERVRVLCLGKAENDEVSIVATEVIRPRGDRQTVGEVADMLVLDAAHLISGERNVVRPLAHDIGRLTSPLRRVITAYPSRARRPSGRDAPGGPHSQGLTKPRNAGPDIHIVPHCGGRPPRAKMYSRTGAG